MDGSEGYLPCYKKIECETSATNQLLAISLADNLKETGDASYIAVCKKFRQKNQPKQLQVDVTSDEPEAKLMTISDIHEYLSGKENAGNIATDFCCWQLCPTIHAETVKYGIADASRLKPRPNKFDHSLTGAMGKLNVKVANSPASKLRPCRSSRLDNRRPKSVMISRPSSTNAKREELGVWQEPAPPIPIPYSFKYLKHPRQYSDQYREMYTYSKLKDSGLNRTSVISGVVVPRGKHRCDNSGRSKVVTSSGNGKLVTTAAPVCSDHIQDKARAHWHLNQKLFETCDMELSVNNPSPTEIAILSKIPHIHRSSPSIPSNTNGKYGGKGTDKPYPFQLNISADARTVRAPSNKHVGRSICIH